MMTLKSLIEVSDSCLVDEAYYGLDIWLRRLTVSLSFNIFLKVSSINIMGVVTHAAYKFSFF